MASLDDIVTVGNSANKNISQLVIALNNFASLYSASAYVTPFVVSTAAATIDSTQSWVNVTYSAGAVTLTLPSAATFPGRVITVKTTSGIAVNSASANVVPIGGTVAGTAILTGAAGKFATLVSNGTNWITMQTNL